MQPPKLVSEILRHVLRVARFDGLSVLLLAGFFALVSAASGDVSGAVFGLLIAAAGAIELHGAALLKAANKRGMRWLIGSQLYLMAVVLGYVAFRMANPDVDPMMKLAKSTLAAQARQAGLDADQFIAEFPTALRILYLGVAFLTILYQGGMSIYYVRRRAAVEKALEEEHLA